MSARRARYTRRIAVAALRGGWHRRGLITRLAPVVDDAAELQPLVQELLCRYRSKPRIGSDALAGLILATAPRPVAPSVITPGYSAVNLRPERWRWPVERWRTCNELAIALRLTPAQLDYFADPGGWNRHAGPRLRHYRCTWIGGETGSVRLLEAPKPSLSYLQRQLVDRVLGALPVHRCAHGFRRGRSPRSFAGPHAAAPVVLRLDLAAFFSTITAARIRGLLRAAGYPDPVAEAIAGLLTVRTPPEVLAVMPRAADPQLRADRWWLVRRLAAPHLPQGAPSSPAAANIVAYRLDRRLCGLAEAMGARYTRYADDLAFSSVAGLDTVALCSAVGSICAAEGFRVRTDKTRIARAHQSQRLAGLVVNADPAPSRRAYDELRAVLHNCARTGPEEQNRSGHADFRAHLRGRMAWLSAGRPNRAARLQGLFDRIVW